LLAKDHVAHNTYAKALDNSGDAAGAAVHLGPLIADGGLLANNHVARSIYETALNHSQSTQRMKIRPTWFPQAPSPK
jgi:hypothetical protein